jgi:capsular exopolysaccharide synthesis family protein
VDLSDYLRILRQRWVVLAACVAVGLIAAFISTPAARGSGAENQEYSATATLLSSTSDQDQRNQELSQAKLFVTSHTVLVEAAKRIPNVGDITALASSVTVETAPDAGLVTVSTQDPSADRAEAVANGFAEAVAAAVASASRFAVADQLRTTQQDLKQAQDALDTLNAQRTDPSAPAPVGQGELSARVTELKQQVDRLNSSVAVQPLRVWEEATPVPVASGGDGFRAPSNLAQRLLIGLALGLLLGAGLALLLDRIDTRLRTRSAVQKAFGLPVVGEIPRLPKQARRGDMVIAAERPETAVAESYRALRSAVLLLPANTLSAGPLWPNPEQATTTSEPRPHRVVLVTSPRPGDGRTTTVVNLAACIAETGKSVLVLDCDLRNPGVHRYLKPPSAEGLSDFLVARGDRYLRAIVQPTSIAGVRVATAGTKVHHPAALLSRVGRIIRSAAALADVVLIDAPPLLTANDAIELIPYVDTVLVVSRAGATTVDNAERTSDALARVQAPVTGVALTAAAGPFTGERDPRMERGWRRVAAALAGSEDTARSGRDLRSEPAGEDQDATMVFGRPRTFEDDLHRPSRTAAGHPPGPSYQSEPSANGDGGTGKIPKRWPRPPRDDDERTP